MSGVVSGNRICRECKNYIHGAALAIGGPRRSYYHPACARRSEERKLAELPGGKPGVGYDDAFWSPFVSQFYDRVTITGRLTR